MCSETSLVWKSQARQPELRDVIMLEQVPKPGSQERLFSAQGSRSQLKWMMIDNWQNGGARRRGSNEGVSGVFCTQNDVLLRGSFCLGMSNQKKVSFNSLRKLPH